jgi:broad specificity phosphatase PhoE
VASPLRRSWEAARIVGAGAPVRLEADFREVDFGRWEGLTREEIEAADPILYRDWQERMPGFEYPDGERREDFVARVKRGLAALEGSGARSALLVIHKGVIRTLGEALLGRALGDGDPPLGGVVWLTRDGSEGWFEGRRGSDPASQGAA